MCGSADRLRVLHLRKLVHLDLKSANVLLLDKSFNLAKIADLGLSKYLGECSVLDHTMRARLHSLHCRYQGVGYTKQCHGLSLLGKCSVMVQAMRARQIVSLTKICAHCGCTVQISYTCIGCGVPVDSHAQHTLACAPVWF